MLRSIAAVLGGFIAMAIVVMVGTMAAAARLMPGGIATMRSGAGNVVVPDRYLAANLTISLLGAVLGGFLAAQMAGREKAAHTVALAAFVLVMSLVSARQGGDSGNGQPSWYPRAIGLIGVAGVLIGGIIVAPR